MITEAQRRAYMNQGNGHNCGNCGWWRSFEGVCVNADSPHRADFTTPDTTCGAWGERQKKGEKL